MPVVSQPFMRLVAPLPDLLEVFPFAAQDVVAKGWCTGRWHPQAPTRRAAIRVRINSGPELQMWVRTTAEAIDPIGGVARHVWAESSLGGTVELGLSGGGRSGDLSLLLSMPRFNSDGLAELEAVALGLLEKTSGGYVTWSSVALTSALQGVPFPNGWFMAVKDRTTWVSTMAQHVDWQAQPVRCSASVRSAAVEFQRRIAAVRVGRA